MKKHHTGLYPLTLLSMAACFVALWMSTSNSAARVLRRRWSLSIFEVHCPLHSRMLRAKTIGSRQWTRDMRTVY